MPSRPIMIAVGGDSGSGKTTFCAGLQSIFGAERIHVLRLDDYHSLDREQRSLVKFSALDPRATNFAALAEDLWALREGRVVEKPRYHHIDGTLHGTESVQAREFLLVLGMFPLYTRATRHLFDVTVWLDPEPSLQAQWKFERDTRERGYNEEQARAEFQRTRADFAAHVAPQAKLADLTVRFYQKDPKNPDRTRLSASIRKGGRLRPLDYDEFSSSATSLEHVQADASGYPETSIEIDGSADTATTKAVLSKLWSHMGMHAAAPPPDLGAFTAADGSKQISGSLAIAEMLVARRVVLIEHELLETA